MNKMLTCIETSHVRKSRGPTKKPWVAAMTKATHTIVKQQPGNAICDLLNTISQSPTSESGTSVNLYHSEPVCLCNKLHAIYEAVLIWNQDCEARNNCRLVLALAATSQPPFDRVLQPNLHQVHPHRWGNLCIFY